MAGCSLTKWVWARREFLRETPLTSRIQTIALLLSEPRHKPSLVVAPVVALMQWKNEIETHAEGFTVCLWHGSGRMKAEQLKKFDVVSQPSWLAADRQVLVSYGTLEASFRRQQRGFKKGNVIITETSPMHSIHWHRYVHSQILGSQSESCSTRRTTSRSGRPMPPRLLLRSRVHTSGASLVLLSRIVWVNYTLWFASWVPILSGESYLDTGYAHSLASTFAKSVTASRITGRCVKTLCHI